MPRPRQILTHAVLILFLALTFLPFLFVLNNAFRKNTEIYHSHFGPPTAAANILAFSWFKLTNQPDRIQLRLPPDNSPTNNTRAADLPPRTLPYGVAIRHSFADLTEGARVAWRQLRPYMFNSLVVSLSTVFAVLAVSSITAYVFSRYHFPGRRPLFLALLSFMMIPSILTLIPSFLLVKHLGLLDTYWAMILPYTAGGQILAVFLFKGFFDGLPTDLFDAAKIDGANHLDLYLHIVLPLSKQILAVVAVMNILSTWNAWLWPFLVNPGGSHHVMSSGLYLMSQSRIADNESAMYAAYTFSFLPLLVLFLYATKPFMSGVTSGAFKA